MSQVQLFKVGDLVLVDRITAARIVAVGDAPGLFSETDYSVEFPGGRVADIPGYRLHIYPVYVDEVELGTAEPAQSDTAPMGHSDDGSGVQKHSEGGSYPYVVYSQQGNRGLIWGIIGPDLPGGALYPDLSYDEVYAVALKAKSRFKARQRGNPVKPVARGLWTRNLYNTGGGYMHTARHSDGRVLSGFQTEAELLEVIEAIDNI